jgi:hypothetical protein
MVVGIAGGGVLGWHAGAGEQGWSAKLFSASYISW